MAAVALGESLPTHFARILSARYTLVAARTPASAPTDVAFVGNSTLLALDKTHDVVIFADATYGHTLYTEHTPHPAPYAHVQCRQDGVVLVSYARGAPVDTFSTRVSRSGLAWPASLHTLFTDAGHGDTLISDMTANPDCSILYILDGVHKQLFVVRVGAYGARLSVLAMEEPGMSALVAPTAVQLLDGDEELLIADWGGGAIYSVHLHLPLPRLQVLAGTGTRDVMVDGDSNTPAALGGPTKMALLPERLGVLFTDRSVANTGSAVRVLRTDAGERGRVTTIAGGDSRADAAVPARPMWGVAYITQPETGVNNGTIALTGPDDGVIWLLQGVRFHWGNCTPGTTPQSAHPPYNGVCVQCPVNTWCRGDTPPVPCESGRESPRGSATESACECAPGTIAATGGTAYDRGDCVLCPENHFCQGGGAAATVCPDELVSAAGARSQQDCACRRGYYPFDGACVLCPPLSFCIGVAVYTCGPSAGVVSLPGSWDPANCSCRDGFQSTGLAVDGTPTCQPCDETELCSAEVVVLESSFELQVPCTYDMTALMQSSDLKRQVTVNVPAHTPKNVNTRLAR